jgi:hypothetical protein
VAISAVRQKISKKEHENEISLAAASHSDGFSTDLAVLDTPKIFSNQHLPDILPACSPSLNWTFHLRKAIF